ncbi:MAG TPA: lytic transglycosylase domain-containing protein [Caulobacteraceae bacterium]|nr:lytic transglycosylase domain-containing protein [Caulobacteraceae bacterium]
MAFKLNLRRALLGGALAAALGGVVLAGDQAAVEAQTPQYAVQTPLSDADARLLGRALEGARLGDPAPIRNALTQLSDPLARKVALWALIDTDPSGMSYAELDAARRDLAGWPGAARRVAATERVIEGGGVSPRATIDWFAGAEPETPEGAMALAAAYQATGQQPKAAEVIRHIWRTRAFDAPVQELMLTRFGALLTADDHAAREDMLLYGAQGPAAHDLLPLLADDQRALALARMAIRDGSSDASSLVAALPASVRGAPGVGYEEALSAYEHGDEAGALALIPQLPTAIPDPEAQTRMWKLRKELVVTALKAGDSRAAYRAAADSGVDNGKDGAEAEFYAGWIALDRLKNPQLADQHFAKLQAIGVSPITVSRALYWRGKAAEAAGDEVSAHLFYGEAANYQTAFYGQLAAAKAGLTEISLGKDPQITAADRARFEDRSEIRAARMLGDIGAKDTFRSFVQSLATTLPDAGEAAQLVDLARAYGEQELSMKVVRTAAQHGFVLPERGYPLREPTSVDGGAETALVLGITREESGFDPHVRSGPGATGMMQLMPGTASVLARRLGYAYSLSKLEDADFNMQLGSAYLGQLVDRFSGSYVMAAAAYNAGPGRPAEWTAFCGDPRSTSTDPADYIECIPFSETRNYVMRVLEATEVYRARLNGGTAPNRLAADLKRGAYGYGVPSPALTAATLEVSGR